MTTRYVEIPLNPSMILREPQGTQNLADDELSRLLVGRTFDPDLGELEATAFFNYSPPIDAAIPPVTAEFVSLELVLKFDFYSFGANDSTELHLSVHELAEPLSSDNSYNSTTSVLYQSVPVGDTVISPGPVMLRTGWELASDNDLTNNTYFSQSIRLSSSLGANLLNDLIYDRTTIDNFILFSSKYPGFAVTMPSGNKILGFTPVYSLPTPSRFDSRLVLQYKDNGTLVSVDFPIYYAVVNDVLNEVTSFTYLNPIRTGSPMEGILPFVDFSPPNGDLYAQSGTGLMPKFDLSSVYEYFDTIPYAVINSAELAIENTYTGRTPEDFEFLLLNPLNQFRGVKIDSVIGGLPARVDDPYLLKIRSGIVPLGVAQETRVAVLNQLTGSTASVDQITGKVGSTVLTEFFQQIVEYKEAPTRAIAFALHPVESEFNKTVSILKMTPASATLKFYYSIPTTAPFTISP